MSPPPPRRVGRGAVRGTPFVLVALFLLAVAAAAVLAVPSPRRATPSDDRAPVDLATPVDMAEGTAHRSAVVVVGRARIEVLSPTILRLEYSPSGSFEDDPSVNVLDRRTPVPAYRARVSGGWLTLRTSALVLRYRVAGGPFTAVDTSVHFLDGPDPVTAHPTWDWECPFAQTCQSGSATLAGGAVLSFSQGGYRSNAGYVGGLLHRGAAVTWHVLGAPAGTAQLSLRYAAPGPSHAAPSTVSLVVDGRRTGVLALPPTSNADPWSDVTVAASLRPGTNSVELRCDDGDRCGADIDTLSVGTPGATVAPTDPAGALGGWIRGFDTFTYGAEPTCAPGTAGAGCSNSVEPLHTDGLLDRAGWRLLDDTRSALWTGRGWVRPRPAHGDVEDGYLFVYGQDYAGALHGFARLTGPAPLLPRNVFGVWYSDYTPYSSGAIEHSVYPAFVAADVPLDTLSLDTDWKAPNDWDGWEWNTSLFPDPTAFFAWARSQGIDVTLNIHSSISLDDPAVLTAQAVAGQGLTEGSCMEGICRLWDWSSIPQAESNFDLQQPLVRQGVGFFWLDWCCDDSVVTMPGLTPDAWIGHLYAQQMVNQGQRGFVLARVGSSNGNPQREYPAGPWSDHTSAIAFTGDAWGTWSTLAAEVALTPDEATIGEPYVSDDIGSYLGPPPQGTQDPPDLYDRWVQFGTFQPVLRLHSNDEERLPWQYPQPVQGITEAFLRLRQELVPYTYTLAAQANRTGLPMARPLYLDYPDQAAAYDEPDEYLYGPDVLVAPVTTAGTTARTTMWIPPGRWVDYFTGATVTGPVTTTVTSPLDRMPVFVRAGGIIPEESASAGTTHAPDHLTLEVYPGAAGTFDLYGDSGTGLGYTKGQFTTTPITDIPASAGGAGATPTLVTVGRTRGDYPGRPARVSYEIDLVDLSAPTAVTLNGRPLDRLGSGSAGPGWSYRAGTDTVVVDTPSLPTTGSITVAASGGHILNRSEPPPSS